MKFWKKKWFQWVKDTPKECGLEWKQWEHELRRVPQEDEEKKLVKEGRTPQLGPWVL